MLKTHEGRTAVVTGAARGMGQAIALGLAERGANVAGVDLNDAGETGELVSATGVEWLGVTGDVSTPEGVDGIGAAVLEKFGAVDILVNNAGTYPQVDWDGLDFEFWKRILRINLDSQFLMCKAFVPGMREKSYGRIVNTASDSVHLPIPHATHYITSKMAVIGFTRGLAADLAEDGIVVNAVSPALTDTGNGAFPQELIPVIAQMQAIKRPAVPNDVVGTIAFLTSEDAAWVTSQTIWADGGLAR
jgi:NAD(P)-dependent dehydrogenase (short-subunit alcohol dehydrogenase family)